MGLGSGLKQLLGRQRADNLQHHLKAAVDQGLERHVRIAVTGLSRSGKTVFISALAHHLLQAHQCRSLPFLEAAATGQIISVKNLSDESSQPFPLEAALDALSAEPPQWPPSTSGLSEVRLAIRYQPANRLKKLLTETSTLYVDIIDYPGEWLLDLPLLNMDFSAWCQQQQALLESEPRAELAADWLTAREAINWSEPVSAARLEQLSQGYNQLLQTFRQQAMSMLQPGRCLLPGDMAGNSLLTLFPLAATTVSTELSENSGYATLEQRFNNYKEEVVRRFYREHFSRFDRQVVLVDCLKALNNGKACFSDMQQALVAVLESFNYGQSGLLRRLFSPRIDKVLFAATKADHVTANQHHNLDKFLQLLIEQAQRDLRFDGIETQCMALASIRSTQAAQAKVDGQQLSCLRGLDKNSGETVALFPGEVPTELPNPADWHSERFQFVDFAPRRLPRQQLKSEHHIRLDQALEYLLGDRL